MKRCDNTSVGVIIENGGDIALLKRAKFPVGIAPPAGHIDSHGTPPEAAAAEVFEELGLQISAEELVRTAIVGRRVENVCRRPGGDYHRWWVFTAQSDSGLLTPNEDEAQGAGWYEPEQVQALAERTRAFQLGQIASEAWEQEPGLEEVWLGFLEELEYVS